MPKFLAPICIYVFGVKVDASVYFFPTLIYFVFFPIAYIVACCF